MKKALSALSTVALSFGVLAGCSLGPDEVKEPANDKNNNKTISEEGMPEKPEKLVVWEDTKKGVALEPAIKAFEKKYGIKVEYKEVEMATKQRDQLRLDGPAGTGPDVITVPHDQIGQLVTEGLIREMKVDKEVIDRFTESSIQAETYNGKLYGLPKATETPVFVYNKKLMDKAPETMDELYEFAKNFTKDEQYGFLALWDNFYFAHGIIGGMGGYVFKNNDGTLDPKDLGLNNEGAVKGAEYIQKWYKEGLFPKGIIGENGGSTMDGLFNEGKVASVMNGPWAFQAMKDAGIDIGVAPMPKLPNGEPVKTFMGVKGWHVSAYSKHPEWATKLIEFITNEENAKIRFELTQEIPPVKSLIEDPIITSNEGAKAVAIQSQYAIPMPNIPEMAEVWGPMATALQLVANQKEEPKKALDEAIKTIKTNIEANHGKK
ncbi:arabinogalactan oligomer/maltooligosaccharide transport system substrate-binding protein [Anoxybacillus calidus]|uniref:Maltodextrin-binding protein n=1 Tax=[Anoxybacillus] calidus TaxID=575178 RepID=A0A7W0BXI5_9BACL|nr:extracellular solute-binding protein [Anoxybacillus calidus]MBA2872064.1 arabinogalactan oligomer/maltooligosaccharide transport system substrate-binding protein [Anoxybacillus calidus]